MNQLASAILQISSIPVWCTCIYSIIIFKSLFKELKIVGVFLIFSGFIDLISTYCWYNSINNMPLLHLYVAGGFFFICLFYPQLLDGFISKKIIWNVLVGFTGFTVINTIFIQPINTYNSYAVVIESILIIILSLSTFMFLLDDIVKETKGKLAVTLNWINSGLFIYYSSSLLIFYFGNVITDSFSVEISQYLWAIPSVASMAMYFCFFIGLWKRPQK
jgi:hypothetical protein